MTAAAAAAPADWSAWAKRHATVFALSRGEDINRLIEWAGIFQRAGWTPGDMLRATEWMAVNDPPFSRAGHLRSLRKALDVLAAREAEEAGGGQAGPPAVSCRDCAGAGLVVVACEKAAEAGRLRRKVVYCGCAAGKWFRESQRAWWLEKKVPPPPTLEDHARWHPRWREDLARLSKVEQSLLAAAEAAGQDDAAHGPLRLPVSFQAAVDAAKRRQQGHQQGQQRQGDRP